MIPDRIRTRFQQRVGGDPDSCWEWPMSTGSHGYGQMGWDEKGERFMALTHRLAWEVFVGPIPEGMTIDHICRNRICCNPAHLRLLSNRDNARDNGFNRVTHCPAGHEYAGDNLYVDPKGHRRCRACDRTRQAAPCPHLKLVKVVGYHKCTRCGELV